MSVDMWTEEVKLIKISLFFKRLKKKNKKKKLGEAGGYYLTK